MSSCHASSSKTHLEGPFFSHTRHKKKQESLRNKKLIHPLTFLSITMNKSYAVQVMLNTECASSSPSIEGSGQRERPKILSISFPSVVRDILVLCIVWQKSPFWSTNKSCISVMFSFVVVYPEVSCFPKIPSLDCTDTSFGRQFFFVLRNCSRLTIISQVNMSLLEVKQKSVFFSTFIRITLGEIVESIRKFSCLRKRKSLLRFIAFFNSFSLLPQNLLLVLTVKITVE